MDLSEHRPVTSLESEFLQEIKQEIFEIWDMVMFKE